MFAKKKKDDLYILVLKYCREHIEKRIRPLDLIKYLDDEHGYQFKSVETHLPLKTILQFAINSNSTIKDDMFYDFTGEAYFRLLEYEELTLARKNAREARWLSIVAIIIAVISTLVSAFK